MITLKYPSQSVDHLQRLAEHVALIVRRGDVIALRGDLGAGKTTFARLLIRGLLGAQTEDVPSPTFSLVQAYQTRRVLVHHFDLYRLRHAGELDEIGFDDAVAHGLVLVEWPERAGAALPSDRLDIVFDETSDPDLRDVSLVAAGSWVQRLQRLREIEDFLGAAGWHDARIDYLQGDASTRAYARLCLDRAGQIRRAVLMNAPRQPDGPPIRDGKPYSRIAHLAEDVRPFVAVANWLRSLGFSAPEILAQDLDRGLLLIEDFGDRVFGREFEAGRSLDELHGHAIDLLAELRAVPPPGALSLADGSVHVVPPHDRGACTIEIELLVDWYWPALKGAPIPTPARQEFMALWDRPLERLERLKTSVALRDFHSPNLMWLEHRKGTARVGLLDFQDALVAHPAYDVVSLLQDARLDVPAALEAQLYQRYCAAVLAKDPTFDQESFAFAYATLGAQRNSKIVGIFTRLALRDGKSVYLRHIPRIWGYLERDLAHPDLAPLKAWYDRYFPVAARRAPLVLATRHES